MVQVALKVRLKGEEREEDVVVDSTDTVLALKSAIAKVLAVPADKQRLVYRGWVLRDQRTVDSYAGLESGKTVTVIAAGGAKSPSASDLKEEESKAEAKSSSSSSSGAAVDSGADTSNPSAQVDPSMMGGLGGMFAGMGGSNFQQMQMQLMQQMRENPQMMEQLMNNPMMQQMSRQLADNPEVLENMFMNNPQIQRVLEDNPELGHLLRDPAVMRQSMELLRNPNLMRELQRASDRALSNIEAVPGGFNSLRRLYRTVQEPLTDAVTDGHRRNGDNGTQRRPSSAGEFNKRSTPNTEPLPNPWAPRRSVPQPSRSGGMFGMGLPAGMHVGGPMSGGGGGGFGSFSSVFQPTPVTRSLSGSSQQQQQQQQRSGSLDLSSVRQALGAASRQHQQRQQQQRQQQNNNSRDEYSAQLEQLHGMGFTDDAANMDALAQSDGDVDVALAILFSTSDNSNGDNNGNSDGK